MKKLWMIGIIFFWFCCQPGVAQLTESWVSNYDGPVVDNRGSNDQVRDIAVDTEGNIYITGLGVDTLYSDAVPYTDILTLKFDADGAHQWTAVHDGPPVQESIDEAGNSLVIDSEGNIIVAGQTVYNDDNGGQFAQLIVIKYNSSGDTLWTRTYDSFDRGDADFRGRDGAGKVVVDDQDNIYVGGTTYQAGSNFHSTDFILIKYNAAGDEQWYQTFDVSNGTGTSMEDFIDMAIDPSGEILITGSTSANFNTDYYTLKYAADGSLQWHLAYNSNLPTTSDFDEPSAIDVDADGKVYVSGTSVSDETGRDIVTIKYGSEGQLEWIARYDNGFGGLDNDDNSDDILVNSAGEVYVIGHSMNTTDTNAWDYMTIKYSGDGDTLWTRRLNHNGAHDVTHKAVLDKEENLYVTGTSSINRFNDNFQFATIKYNAQGDSLWFAHTTETNDAVPAAMDVDDLGNLVVAGTQNLFSSANMIVVKYEPNFTSISGNEHDIPLDFRLNQNYPNPFNPSTLINFEIPPNLDGQRVILTIYAMDGRKVATLVDRSMASGNYNVRWNTEQQASGVYLYRLNAGTLQKTRNMTLIK